MLHLVVFVLKRGCNFDKKEVEIIISMWRISRISALVVTHCECLSEEEREEMIEQFKKDHPSVAELMGKGILAVGFPDNSHIQPGSELSQNVEEDKANLRQLIYSCDKPVFITEPLKNEIMNQQSPQNKSRQPAQSESRPPPHSENRQPSQNKSGEPLPSESRQPPQIESRQPPPSENRQPSQNKSGEPPPSGSGQPLQNTSKRSFRCSIL